MFRIMDVVHNKGKRSAMSVINASVFKATKVEGKPRPFTARAKLSRGVHQTRTAHRDHRRQLIDEHRHSKGLAYSGTVKVESAGLVWSFEAKGAKRVWV